jgi:putative restriction endonuclease
MTTAISSIIASQIDKAAFDESFDQELPRDSNWLNTFDETEFLATLSQQNVVRVVGECSAPMAPRLLRGVLGGRTVTDVPSPHRLLRRAFQLRETLLDELQRSFEKRTTLPPKTTEAERLVVQWFGETLCHQGRLEFWEVRSAISELATSKHQRASHIKSWTDCDSEAERLDIHSERLFAPHYTAGFNWGFIAVSNDRTVVVDGKPNDDAQCRPGTHGKATGTMYRWRTSEVSYVTLRESVSEIHAGEPL